MCGETSKRGTGATWRRGWPRSPSDGKLNGRDPRSPFKGVYSLHGSLRPSWLMCSGTIRARLQIQAARLPRRRVLRGRVSEYSPHAGDREGIKVSARTALVFTVENGEVTCLRVVRRAGRGTRGRRAAGVGDVGGERRDCPLKRAKPLSVGGWSTAIRWKPCLTPAWSPTIWSGWCPPHSTGGGSLRVAWSLVEFLPISGWASGRTFGAEVEQVIDAGDDRVVSIRFARVPTGKGSGVPVEWKQGAVNERDGRVIRTTYYLHPRRRPRSRRTAGVGDVAGERRGNRARRRLG